MVQLTATKSATKQEKLPDLFVHEKLTTSQEGRHAALTISTVIAGEHTQAKIDYLLAVPTNTTLHITTDKGSIDIDKIEAPCILRSCHGSIQIGTAFENVTANIDKKGDICIYRALKKVQAATCHGNISVTNSYDTICATVHEKGNITVTSANPSLNGETALNTKSGTITLALLEQANATIYGKAIQGTITSDHVITLNPLSTTLNKQAWERFRQEITGVVGTGGADAHQIKLTCDYGNIKIAKHITS
jgi:hypothetical protein